MLAHRVALAMLVLAPGIAAAQFTTFMPPKTRAEDSVRVLVLIEKEARADTAARVRLTNMKAWVDSAAAAAAQRSVRVDSAAGARRVPPTPTLPPAPIRPPTDDAFAWVAPAVSDIARSKARGLAGTD